MFCTKCGTENQTNARFCHKCGHAMSPDEGTTTKRALDTEASQPKKERKRFKFLWTVIVGAGVGSTLTKIAINEWQSSNTKEIVIKNADDLLNRLALARENATKEKTAIEILKEETNETISKNLGESKTNKHKLEFAAGAFFGAYLQNTKERVDYCAALGVKIDSFVREYKKVNLPIYMMAAKVRVPGINENGEPNFKKYYKLLEPALKPVLVQDMKDAASANNMTTRDVCIALEERSVEIAKKMDFKTLIPDAYKILLNKFGHKG